MIKVRPHVVYNMGTLCVYVCVSVCLFVCLSLYCICLSTRLNVCTNFHEGVDLDMRILIYKVSIKIITYVYITVLNNRFCYMREREREREIGREGERESHI